MSQRMSMKQIKHKLGLAARSPLPTAGFFAYNPAPKNKGEGVKIPHPVPHAAAMALTEARRDMLLSGGPHNFPLLIVYNDKQDMLIMGDEGWSSVKCVEWARAYIIKFGARRFELSLVAYTPVFAITARHMDQTAAIVTIVDDLDRGRAIVGTAMTGDAKGRTITGFDDKLPLDLTQYSTLTMDLLKPDPFFITDRVKEIADRELQREALAKQDARRPAQRSRRRWKDRVQP